MTELSVHTVLGHSCYELNLFSFLVSSPSGVIYSKQTFTGSGFCLDCVSEAHKCRILTFMDGVTK